MPESTPLVVGRTADKPGNPVPGESYFDWETKRLTIANPTGAWLDLGLLSYSLAGGNTARGLVVTVSPLAGTGAFRFGGLYIDMERVAGQDFATGWDGNSDTGLKILVRNFAANASNRGGLRALDIQARNSGSFIANIYSANFNARSDVGTDAFSIRAVQIRAEVYGATHTEVIGLDVNMSVENDTGSPAKSAILIRNTDGSGMTAVREAILISHTSTNGFTNLLNFSGASGEGIAVGSLKDSAAADIKCVDRIAILFNGATRYIAVYDTVV